MPRSHAPTPTGPLTYPPCRKPDGSEAAQERHRADHALRQHEGEPEQVRVERATQADHGDRLEPESGLRHQARLHTLCKPREADLRLRAEAPGWPRPPPGPARSARPSASHPSGAARPRGLNPVDGLCVKGDDRPARSLDVAGAAPPDVDQDAGGHEREQQRGAAIADKGQRQPRPQGARPCTTPMFTRAYTSTVHVMPEASRKPCRSVPSSRWRTRSVRKPEGEKHPRVPTRPSSSPTMLNTKSV